MLLNVYSAQGLKEEKGERKEWRERKEKERRWEGDADGGTLQIKGGELTSTILITSVFFAYHAC